MEDNEYTHHNELPNESMISNEIETSPEFHSPNTFFQPLPTRPPRPNKPPHSSYGKSPHWSSLQNQFEEVRKIRKPDGPPPRPKGPPPKLPPHGVQLTRSGRRHPGLRLQARRDKKNNFSFPKLDKAWRGRRIL